VEPKNKRGNAIGKGVDKKKELSKNRERKQKKGYR
jgi:hypothetical protein